MAAIHSSISKEEIPLTSFKENVITIHKNLFQINKEMVQIFKKKIEESRYSYYDPIQGASVFKIDSSRIALFMDQILGNTDFIPQYPEEIEILKTAIQTGFEDTANDLLKTARKEEIPLIESTLKIIKALDAKPTVFSSPK